MSYPFALRLRAEFAVVDRDLLLARARVTARRTGAGPVRGEDDALRVLLADLRLADLLAELDEYGLAAGDAAVQATRGHDPAPGWTDRPWPGIDPDTVIAHVIDDPGRALAR